MVGKVVRANVLACRVPGIAAACPPLGAWFFRTAVAAMRQSAGIPSFPIDFIGKLLQHGDMARMQFLVRRRHVDLRRQAAALCPA